MGKKFVNVNLAVSSNTFKRTPGGRDYMFEARKPTKVFNKDDIKFFESQNEYRDEGVIKDIVGKVKKAVTSKKSDKKEKDFQANLISIKGIGPETANVLDDRYQTWKDFVMNVTLKDLIAVSGINRDRAEKIIKQVESIRVSDFADEPDDEVPEDKPEAPSEDKTDEAKEDEKGVPAEDSDSTTELFKLNKDEQTEILTELGVKEADIPKLEKDRVDKIIELRESDDSDSGDGTPEGGES